MSLQSVRCRSEPDAHALAVLELPKEVMRTSEHDGLIDPFKGLTKTYIFHSSYVLTQT